MRRMIPITLLILLTAGGFCTNGVEAAVPRLLAWQGVALDSLDQPLADGSYLFSFSIWSADVGGDSVWGESQVVEIENGVINVLLGSEVTLADAVFGSPNRWLQVQFESEAPYFPRTQIVSTAYTYRAGSIDGALGGRVHSDIELWDNFTQPSLRLFREGTSTVLGEMTTNGGGGVLNLNDNAGDPILGLQPNADNAGAQYIQSTHPSFVTGILMDNTGSDNPFLLMQGQTTGALFWMDSAGDNSVVLPAAAINNQEILDEPGVAQGHNASFVIPGVASMVDLTTVTISIPDTGYVYLHGRTMVEFSGSTTGGYCFVQVDETAGGNSVAGRYSLVGLDVLPSTGAHYLNCDAQMVYLKNPGTYTFRLEAKENAGATVRCYYSYLSAIFIPSSYGAVNTVVSNNEAGDFSASSPISPETLPGQAADATTSPAYKVDLRELELRAAKTAAVARQAELDLLRAKLQAAGSALEDR